MGDTVKLIYPSESGRFEICAIGRIVGAQKKAENKIEKKSKLFPATCKSLTIIKLCRRYFRRKELPLRFDIKSTSKGSVLFFMRLCDQTSTSMAYFARCSRPIMALAASLSTNSSLAGSHWSFSSSCMVMLARWQSVTLR